MVGASFGVVVIAEVGDDPCKYSTMPHARGRECLGGCGVVLVMVLAAEAVQCILTIPL